MPAIDTPAVLLENEAARRVRRNWLGSLSRLSRLSKIMLFVTTFLTVAQVLASAVVLALSTNDTCDQARMGPSMFVVRVPK